MVRQLVLCGLAVLLHTHTLLAQAAPAVQGDSACSPVMRRPGWASICGHIVDSRTGRGVAGGYTRFEREDGALAFGNVEPDGTFRLNTQAGRGTFALAWGCRTALRHREPLTLEPGRGISRVLVVEVEAKDTLCHIRIERADTTVAAFTRWLDRGPCFSVSFGPWTQEVAAEWLRAHRVRLDPMSSAPKNFRDTPSFADLELDSRTLPWRSWRPLVGDSLELGWSTGFAGVAVALHAAGDSLVGYAQWRDDVIRRDSLGMVDWSHLPRARAVARRVSCPE